MISSCCQTSLAWTNSGLVYYCAISALVFFIAGLLLGRRWKNPVNTGNRPVFNRKPAFQGQPSAPRRDGPVEIYVGNLSLDVVREDLEREFGRFGKVQNIRMIAKHGEKKGFGFVEMGILTEAEKAIKALHGQDLKGSVLEVNIAKSPRSHRRQNRRR